MRVAFFGKGGSGKTTVAAGFINFLKEKTDHILAIDADMNVHLGNTLQMEYNSICNEFNQVAEYLEGNRLNSKVNESNSFMEKAKKIMTSEEKPIVIGTTPPALTSKFITPKKDDEFIKKYSTQNDNISLITVGTYEDNEVGHSCYHSKLQVLELIYNHLIDDNNDIVIADSTAGVDSVGTSMFFVYDINIFVVEPTQRSLSVYLDFEKISEKYNLNTYVIGNKITDDEDIEFLKTHILDDKLIATIKSSNHMRKFEQGNTNAFDEFTKSNTETFEKVHKIMQSTEKNWNKYYNILLDIYKANCKEWYNSYYGQDLEKYIDPEFNYNKVMVTV